MSASVIGAQLYTLRDFLKTPDDVRKTFARVRDMGYEAVQCSGLGPIGAPELKQVADDASRAKRAKPSLSRYSCGMPPMATWRHPHSS